MQGFLIRKEFHLDARVVRLKYGNCLVILVPRLGSSNQESLVNARQRSIPRSGGVGRLAVLDPSVARPKVERRALGITLHIAGWYIFLVHVESESRVRQPQFVLRHRLVGLGREAVKVPEHLLAHADR